jgi:uncharacterized cupredoxin-like copper-binding protein
MSKFLRTWAALVPAAVLVIAAACSGSSTSSSGPASVAGGGRVGVTLKEWAIGPNLATIPAGSVIFTVNNEGTMPHEFVVLKTDTPAGAIPITSFEGISGRINEDTAGTNVGETGDLTAGETKTLTIDLAPGHYAFVCNLPAHYGQGMHIDFTVS